MSLQIASQIVDASAFQVNDGSISITTFGGTQPYTYAWSNGLTTPDIIVGAGVYMLVIKDANNLTLTSSFTVNQPLEFKVDSALPDVALLSDVSLRDLYCRRVIGNSVNVLGRQSAVLTQSLYTSPTSYRPVTTMETYLDSGNVASTFFAVTDANAIAQNIMRLTSSDVHIYGNLIVDGGQTNVTVNHIDVEDKLITLNSSATTLTSLDSTGIQLGDSSL